MGSAKKHQRIAKNAPQLRSRITRSTGGKLLLSDPAQNTQLLTDQLRTLGLYAANTLGDGNCLFRALSDQLYGTAAHHLQLRKDICDWIEAHKERYAPFVEDERGLDVHLRCMREPGTYGGHLELSAFAHFARRNVKVIQPGLVYVIEWAAGSPDLGTDSEPRDNPAEAHLDERQKRRLRREKVREDRDDDGVGPEIGAVYVAYHDWEHFSSIRNLTGPHAGLPLVVESPAPTSTSPTSPSPREKPVSRSKPKSKTDRTSKSKRTSILLVPPSDPDATMTMTPSHVPLPPSRSPSPGPDLILPPPAFPVMSALAGSGAALRTHRSPKRTFDESELSSGASGASQSSEASSHKRSRMRGSHSREGGLRSTRSSSRLRHNSRATTTVAVTDADVEADADVDADTPGLSAPSSGTESTSSSPSPLATPPPSSLTPPAPVPTGPALTRRQRKRLGLPKPRPVGTGAGKILIPGGKMVRQTRASARRASAVGEGGGESDGEAVGDGEDEGEWKRNGTGRLDVRGFRELKI